MMYVSLPVHENFDVVANQLQNFARYLPEAMVVIHVSKQATFDQNQLQKFLQLYALDNYIVNPEQAATRWGNIFAAHLANVRMIAKQQDATKVLFHSSNDMLVKEGLAAYLADKNNLFHYRPLLKDSHWVPANRARGDIKLTDWLTKINAGRLIGSQIEGSVYEMPLLKSLLATIDNAVVEAAPNYPQEEIIFSSFAVANGVVADGLPYVLSEVHRFDALLWGYFSGVVPVAKNKRIKKLLQKRLVKQANLSLIHI